MKEKDAGERGEYRPSRCNGAAAQVALELLVQRLPRVLLRWIGGLIDDLGS
jgi:hypothetical protein